MNYAQIRKYDVANGEGIRTTLFVSGCKFNCKSCFNKEYQDFNYGNEWTKETEDYFINLGKDENVAGYSLLGGEIFQQSPDIILHLCKRIKEETGKTIWVWTGYTFENIPLNARNILNYIDVLVDGQFIEELKDLRLEWRGSSNQKIYKKSERGVWHDYGSVLHS